jgi:hypothetical protein
MVFDVIFRSYLPLKIMSVFAVVLHFEEELLTPAAM